MDKYHYLLKINLNLDFLKIIFLIYLLGSYGLKNECKLYKHAEKLGNLVEIFIYAFVYI